MITVAKAIKRMAIVAITNFARVLIIFLPEKGY
jgi:hypothetical protein